MAGNILFNSGLILALLILTILIGVPLGYVKTAMVLAYQSAESHPGQTESYVTWIDTAMTALTYGVWLIIFFLMYTSFFGGEEFKISTFLIDYVLAILFTAFAIYTANYVISALGSDFSMLNIVATNFTPLMVLNLVVGGLAAVFKSDKQ